MDLVLQFFGGRGASGLPTAHPGGGGNSNIPWTQTPNIKSPDTLKEALGEKGRPMGIAEAARDANPYYSSAYREFSENCQRAVIAYEARRRGYDVEAQPTYNGDQLPYTHPGQNPRWSGAFQNAKVENMSSQSSKKAMSNVDNAMASYGNGARAIMRVTWTKTGEGHVINVERQAGRTIYVDAQIGAKYNANELFSGIRPSKVSLIRTDNLRFSDRAKKSIEVSGSRK